ncbi:MAG: hypothetical protein AMJ90_09665, partial [candidate division Zixibacteria bacterium SM23_73_2]
MQLTSIFIYCLIPELRQDLPGKKIKRILISQDKKNILILVRDKNEQKGLFFSSHPDFFRTEILSEKEIQGGKINFSPTSFFKHLENTRIQKIEQLDFDRVINISCIRKTKEKEERLDLVMELTGRNSNLILKRSKDERILDCLKKIDPQKSRYRQIGIGLKYNPPPHPEKKNPFKIEKESFEKLLKEEKEKEVGKFLIQTFNGLDDNLSQRICYDSFLKPDAKINQLSPQQKTRFWENFCNIIKDLKIYKISPRIILDENKNPTSLSLFDLPSLSQDKKLEFEKLNSALKEFFKQKIEKEKFIKQKTNLSLLIHKNIFRLEKRLVKLEKDQEEAKDYQKYKRFGDLLIFYQTRIKKGKDKIILKDAFEETQPEVEIEINPLLSPLKNAQAYFKKYKKSKEGQKVIKTRLEKTNSETKELENLLSELEKKEKLSNLEKIKDRLLKLGYSRKKEKIKKEKKKKKLKYSPREFSTSEGLKILVGKSQQENDYLTFHIAKSYDLWFHAQDVGGSHVILKKQTKDQSPSKESITQAAKAAAYFSQARESSKV